MEKFEFQFVRTEKINEDGKEKIKCNICGAAVIYKEGAYSKHFRGAGHIKKFEKLYAETTKKAVNAPAAAPATEIAAK